MQKMMLQNKSTKIFVDPQIHKKTKNFVDLFLQQQFLCRKF